MDDIQIAAPLSFAEALEAALPRPQAPAPEPAPETPFECDVAADSDSADPVARAGEATATADAVLVPPDPAPSAEQLRRAVCAAGAAAWHWDLRTNDFVCSEAAGALLGLGGRVLRAPEELWQLIVPEDRSEHRALLHRALAARASYVSRFRVVRPCSGQIVWLEDRGGFVEDDQLRGAGLLVDVTAHKREDSEREETRRLAEELLARQRREQQTILDSVRAMIWYKDADNRILRCNKAAAQSMGLRVEDMIGKKTGELYPDEAAEYQRTDQEVIATGQPKLGIIEPLKVFDGSRRFVQTDKIPYRDAEGRVVGVIVFAMDVTERKQAEDVLRESEQTQREFVANVSHEFRTPVAAIKGFAETLRRGALDDKRQRARFVRIIENHANRLQWLVEDLLTLSSLESGTDKLKLEPIALRDFVAEYLGSVGTIARKAGVTLTPRVPRTTRVRADQGFFLQVLENLVGNAIKYNRRGGWVRVEAVHRGDFVHLTVRDNGIGIPAASVPRIFDRFYRVNKGAASGATGLGLHIVQKIVEAHGGRIWVESRLGRGSAFHLLVPAAPSRRLR